MITRFGKGRGGSRRAGPAFVAARPTLSERLRDLKGTSPRRTRWFAAAGWVAAAPARLVAVVSEGAVGAVRFVFSAGRDAFATRRLRHLIQGFPSVFVATVAAATALVAAGQATRLPDDYRVRAARAFAADRVGEAELLYERLYRLDGGRAETRLMLGLTFEKLGRSDEAETLIRGVAEGDGGGDARANRWVASKLLADPKAAADPVQRAEIHRHLLAARRGLPADPSVAVDLAKYYLLAGLPRRAIPHLETAAAAAPVVNADLARLYAAAGRTDAARSAVERGEVHFRSLLESDPRNRDARLALVSFVAMAGRLDEAIELLKEGLSTDPGGPYAGALANAHVLAYDRVASQPTPDHRFMIHLLREALRYDPRSSAAAIRLANFDGGPVGNPDASPDAATEAEATKLLEGLLASGEQPAAVHMALGLKASRRGEIDEAAWHFERAYDLDGTLAGVANNLAWTLAQQESPDLPRALSVIDSVLQRWPDVPAYLDTRGEIYLRMGRWEEALRDLERALPAMRSDPRLHRSLAEAYRRLGRQGMAEMHLREAERSGPARQPLTEGSPREEPAAITPTPPSGG